MWKPDYFVRYVDFPVTVKGVTIPNDDGTFDIYINSVLCEEQQRECLEHELCHICKDHFYTDVKPIREVEREASGNRPYQFGNLALEVQ